MKNCQLAGFSQSYGATNYDSVGGIVLYADALWVWGRLLTQALWSWSVHNGRRIRDCWRD